MTEVLSELFKVASLKPGVKTVRDSGHDRQHNNLCVMKVHHFLSEHLK